MCKIEMILLGIYKCFSQNKPGLRITRDQEGLGGISFFKINKFDGDLEADPESLAAMVVALVRFCPDAVH